MTQQFQSGLQVVLTDNEAFTGYNISWCIFNFLVALLQFTLGCISFCVQSKKKGTKNDVDVFNQEDVDQTEVVIKVPRTSFWVFLIFIWLISKKYMYYYHSTL